MKFGVTRMISERSRKFAAEEVDLLLETEAAVMAELARKVHLDGFVGTAWPTVRREPMWRGYGDLRPMQADELQVGFEPIEWRISATVEAVPR